MDLQDISRRLFAAANQLWTNTALRPDQYGQPVLALIALRQMEARGSRLSTPSWHRCTRDASSPSRATTKHVERFSCQITPASPASCHCPVRQTSALS
jgi:hypothetical protein